MLSQFTSMHWRTSLETESKNRTEGEGGFFSWRVLLALLFCAGACAITTGTLPATAGKLAFLHPEVPSKLFSQNTDVFQGTSARQN